MLALSLPALQQLDGRRQRYFLEPTSLSPLDRTLVAILPEPSNERNETVPLAEGAIAYD
jgi:hypothetical protein